VISPTNGISPEDINIEKLLIRVKKENFEEIIIATSSNIDGELTAMYLNKVLSNLGFNAYRIGYGLPASTDLEYVDEITLIRSLESKKVM
jgi:recombination protein RecR